MGNFWDTGS